jgi:hypothetical protein
MAADSVSTPHFVIAGMVVDKVTASYIPFVVAVISL